jgi:hypothetical protein
MGILNTCTSTVDLISPLMNEAGLHPTFFRPQAKRGASSAQLLDIEQQVVVHMQCV